uniref:Homing endonuclease LAGLIDADG domain-containing protein n=1 Tax=Russula griseocarnosa TaxID=466936 RepID=A0A649UCT9_9AGAM|nr:hypothetical protein [Russula griseocarnosa]QGI24999.1 hypothetical protein [Russula griseocarnosa]
MAECLKWDYNENLTYSIIGLNVVGNEKFSYKIKKLTSKERIGPHNKDIISMIIGSTLGDTHLEKRKNGIGTRIIFEQSSDNVEYLMWFHNYLTRRGYCSNTKPKLQIRIRQKGKVYYQYRISSYTFSSFNWIHEMFYKLVDNKYIKIVPLNIEEYLTPLALSIWFMDDGSSLGKSARIATNCFTFEEVNFLCSVLKSRYNIIATPNKCGKDKGHIIYIHTDSMKLFTNIVKPYLLPSLYYKLGSNK